MSIQSYSLQQGRDMYGLMRLTGKEYYKFEYHELGGKNVVYFYRGKDKLRDPWGVNFTTTTCWTSKTMESFIDFIRKSAIEEINAEAKEKTNLGAVLAGHAFCIEIDKSSMTGLGQMIFRGVKTYEYVEFTATKYIVAIISLPEGERLTVQSLRRASQLSRAGDPVSYYSRKDIIYNDEKKPVYRYSNGVLMYAGNGNKKFTKLK